jgi:hypothetical protein
MKREKKIFQENMTHKAAAMAGLVLLLVGVSAGLSARAHPVARLRRRAAGVGAVLQLRGGRAPAGARGGRTAEWEHSSDAVGEGDHAAQREQMLLSAVEEAPHDAIALGELGEWFWETQGDIG